MPAAVTDAYVTVEEYKAIAGRISPEKADAVAGDLLSTTREIEKRLGRFFTKDASAQSRIFMPPPGRGRFPDGWAESENPWRATGAKRVLQIDDLVSVTSITIDEARDNTFSTTLTTNDYELLPRNAAKGPESWPYTQIELTSWGSHWAWLPSARVKVTGVWGWPSVPEPIKNACIDLTRIRRNEIPEGLQASEDTIWAAVASYGKVTF